VDVPLAELTDERTPRGFWCPTPRLARGAAAPSRRCSSRRRTSEGTTWSARRARRTSREGCSA